ncbi:MAG: hypothetical protein AB9834_18960 [Lentimicrobium sp.]
MNDERNKMDELFREGLGDFNPVPPPGLWERIDAGIPAPTPVSVPSTSGSGRLLMVGISALLFTGLILLWWFTGSGPESSEKNNNIRQTEIPVTANSASSAQETDTDRDLSVNTSKSTPNNHSKNQSQELDSKQNFAANPLKTKAVEDSQVIDVVEVIQSPFDHSAGAESTTVKVSKAEYSSLTELRRDFTSWLNMKPAGLNTIPVASPFDNRYKTSEKPGLPRRNRMPVIGGVYASMDWIDYGSGNKKQSMAAGISLSTFKGPWLVETGLAYSLSEDNGRFMISYNSYDSIGYYNKVVSFTPDPENPGTVQFNTEVQGVYDSIDHELETKTNNRYSYLQIPLMAGYQLYAGRLFTIGLKAGPVFSVMLGSDEPAAAFEQEGTTLNSIDNLSPQRVSTNWQVAAGLGIGMHLSPRLTLLAEPTYKYYLRPVYQNHNTKPQSIGIKAGLLYRF